ncbi:YpmS family protein [Lactococcus formosensis]|uniref:YpmS family protein n=1 Tax=Lactococcus formosensis TaxID=1281486 RepID=A0A9X4SB13_9LACT|nr:YpmS family protein [Lactococcus formosensis]MDG6110786.1 YpmS family protein [Lactococcus formosensis]MDG6116963.1 YpmS family protein [Lactococcus formosensis]MDG6132335.1 YpmS family protein [Lactococcus formosensis]MDG6134330.1 YpmS family protein [Lactococcus formosensis]MDG6138066.1 YpmS family protein [Lactococcus formosensis]
MKNKKTIWKWLFLALLAINLGTFAFISSRVFNVRDQQSLGQVSKLTETTEVAKITTDRSQLNQLINTYLQDFQTSEMSYKFYLSNSQAVLEASYQLFGQKIPLYIYFEPLALNDGSVALQVKNVSAGTLNLPTSAVLAYVKSSIKLPNFVEVLPTKDQVILHLPQLALADNLYLKANQLDLVSGNFTFNLMIQP